MIKTLLTVFILGLGTSLLLSLTNTYTRDQITENRRLHKNHMLLKLLSDHDLRRHINTASQRPECTDWQIRKVKAPGYSGSIEAVGLVQFRDQGNLLSLRVINHSETPGIGDFIDDQKNPWIKNLDSKTEQQWLDVDLVSGATITSKAIKTIATRSFSLGGGQCDLYE